MSYDPNQPRDDHGRFGSGAGAAIAGAVGKAGSALAGAASKASDWVTSGEAKAALSGLITADRVKTAVALGIKSALYHVAGLDDAAMEVIDPIVHNQVHNISANLQVSTGRARDLMIAATRALITARSLGK